MGKRSSGHWVFIDINPQPVNIRWMVLGRVGGRQQSGNKICVEILKMNDRCDYKIEISVVSRLICRKAI